MNPATEPNDRERKALRSTNANGEEATSLRVVYYELT